MAALYRQNGFARFFVEIHAQSGVIDEQGIAVGYHFVIIWI